jgi:D-alanyl-D-alanine carboxypeptidase
MRMERIDLDVAQIRAIVEAERQKAGTAAVLFGMWQGDRELLTVALGNSMTTVPATTDMHYRIGGITETFQSTLVMMLAEQGRLNLDHKISRWFPDLLSADQVTIRMLVGNTAGYLDYVLDEAFEDASLSAPFRTFTDEELIAYAVRDGKMNYPPGTSQAYSHTEYVILGQVVQRATGQTMKELYEENILGPHGFDDTQFPTDQNIQEPVLHAYSNDRKIFEDSTYWNSSWASATGALTSNLHDLGRWGPMFGQGRLVSPASFAEMTAPTSVGKGNNRPDAYFAYGFAVTNGWYVQNPNMNGYSGAFAYNPTHGITLVVEATKNANPAIDPAGIHILREVIKYVTPDSPLAF